MQSETTITIARTSSLPVGFAGSNEEREVKVQIRLDLTVKVSRDPKSERLVEIHEYRIVNHRTIGDNEPTDNDFGPRYFDLHTAYKQYTRVAEQQLTNHEHHQIVKAS